MTTRDPNGSGYWSTTDELNRLRLFADIYPLKLLAAYNATKLRSNWGTMDGEQVKAEASKLARKVLEQQDGLINRIKPEWPWAVRLAEAVQNGR